MRRRELLLAAGGAGIVAAVAGPAARALAQVEVEANTLTRVARVEHDTVFAYDAIAAAGVLRPGGRRLARRIRAHEAEHAAAFVQALSDLQWPLPEPPERLEQVRVPVVRERVPRLRTADDAFALALALEDVSILALRAAQRRLREAPHQQLAASIVAAEAEHLVAWRRAAGRPLLPSS